MVIYPRDFPRLKKFLDSFNIKTYLSKRGYSEDAIKLRLERYTGLNVNISNDAVKVDYAGIVLIVFNLQRYPSCCGIYIFHSFYAERACFIGDSFVVDFMKAFVEDVGDMNNYQQSGFFGVSNRLDLVMVQYNGEYKNMLKTTYEDDEDEDSQKHSKEEDVYNAAIDFNQKPFDEKEELKYIQFPQFYEFFTKHTKACRVRRMYNANSGNLLHQMEVIL